MAQANNGGNGHEQSIGSPTDQPVDGIAGSHPGTQEPSGAHVDAGKTRHGEPQREKGNQQQSTQRTGSFANVRQPQGLARPVDDSLTGSQGAGSAYQGGNGDSMQGGAGARGQWHALPPAGLPQGAILR